MHNNSRLSQQRANQIGPVLIVILVTLTVFVISGGTGLVFLAAGQYQNRTTPQITPSSKSILLSSLSPQQLYTRITSAPPAIVDPLTRADTLLWRAAEQKRNDRCSYSAQGLVMQAGFVEDFPT